VTRLNEITVTSTRGERRVDRVPNTVSVITAEQIEREGARDIKDVFRDELDVVRAAPTRFTAGAATGRAGNEGINIRGLEGNQVLMLVDGIRLPNSFSFGAFATGRGDFLDVDGIKTVEVRRPGLDPVRQRRPGRRGEFRTLDPSDLLKRAGGGGFARSSYASVDRSWPNTLGLAGQSGRWQGLLLGSYRQGHEVDNRGGNDRSTPTAPRPTRSITTMAICWARPSSRSMRPSAWV
jgi:hemoglobin/transferrin/lactoferrin receptor protein